MSYREDMDLQMEIQPITQAERNNIKEAVKAAYFPDGEWASLPGNPIVFECHGEDGEEIPSVAYWPSSLEIGEKFLCLLRETMCEREILTHCKLVDIILNAHRAKDAIKRCDRIIDANPDLLLGIPNAMDQLGRFARIGEPNKSKGGKKAFGWYMKRGHLSPHLFRQDCLSFV